MQRLLLVRHAKAAAIGQTPGDDARPLSAKGQAMAHALGQVLTRAGWMPDQAVVSAAKRTRETWQGMAAALPPCAAVYDKSLYLGAPAAFTQILAKHGKTSNTLALVGHNPGVALFAHHLVAQGFDHDAAARRRLAGHFKTGWAAAFEMREAGPRLAALFDPRL